MPGTGEEKKEEIQKYSLCVCVRTVVCASVCIEIDRDYIYKILHQFVSLLPLGYGAVRGAEGEAGWKHG